MNYRESLRALRGERDPVQPRVAAARDRVRDPQGHRRRRPHQARPGRRSSGWATSTRGATGASPATTSTRCGGCCSRTDAAGLRGRHRRDPQRARAGASSPSATSGSTGGKHVVSDPAFIPAGRGGPAPGRSGQGAARARLDAEGRLRASWCAMMVDADLERLARHRGSQDEGAGHRRGRLRRTASGATAACEAGHEVTAACRPVQGPPSSGGEPWSDRVRTVPLELDDERRGPRRRSSARLRMRSFIWPRWPRCGRLEQDPGRAWEVNAAGTARLLDALVSARASAGVAIRSCSWSRAGEVYGARRRQCRERETTRCGRCRPTRPARRRRRSRRSRPGAGPASG